MTVYQKMVLKALALLLSAASMTITHPEWRKEVNLWNKDLDVLTKE